MCTPDWSNTTREIVPTHQNIYLGNSNSIVHSKQRKTHSISRLIWSHIQVRPLQQNVFSRITLSTRKYLREKHSCPAYCWKGIALKNQGIGKCFRYEGQKISCLSVGRRHEGVQEKICWIGEKQWTVSSWQQVFSRSRPSLDLSLIVLQMRDDVRWGWHKTVNN